MAPSTPQKAAAGPSAFPAELSLQPLKNCLSNLPAALVTVLVNANKVIQEEPLLRQSTITDLAKVAQNVIVELQYTPKAPAGAKKKDKPVQKSIYVGWTGMPSKRKTVPVIGAGRTPTKEREVAIVEVDSTFANTLGLADGMKVSGQLCQITLLTD